MFYGKGSLYSGLARRNRVRRQIISCVIICIVTGSAVAGCDKDDDNNGDGYNATDQQFVMMASMSNYAEIQAGRVASNKAEDDGIAEFGDMMISDHTTAGTQLKSIATGIGLPTKDSLDQAHVMLMDTLASLSGRAFDSVYINSQVVDHQKAISLFEDEVENGQHAELKEFASETLPHLQMHLNHADSLRNAY